LRCTKCRMINYCSQQCQKDDWPHHKNHCTPWSSTKDKCSTPLAEVAKQVSGTTGTASGRAPVAKESIFSYVATANIKRLAKLTADAENRLLLVAAAAELAATSASSRHLSHATVVAPRLLLACVATAKARSIVLRHVKRGTYLPTQSPVYQL